MKILYAIIATMALSGCSASTKTDGSGVKFDGTICANGYCLVPAPPPVTSSTLEK